MVTFEAGGLASTGRFERLVEPHLDPMFRRARSVLRSEDLAWDAVQDTLVAVWKNDRLPEDARPVLLSVVQPKSFAQLRARRRRDFHEGCACERCRESDGVDPSASAEHSEFVARLAQAIARLPDELRGVAELRLNEDLEYAEMAARLGVKIGTVRSRLHRARNRIADDLGIELGESTTLQECA